MGIKVTTRMILEERSRLQHVRASISDGCTLIQLGVNIPGVNKNIYPSKELWKEGRQLLINLLKENSILVIKVIDNETLIGNFTWFIVSENSYYIKKLCLQLEKQISISSYLDIDVFTESGEKVRRIEIGEMPRKCFLCKEPAKVCAFLKTHSIDKLLETITIEYQDYKRKKGPNWP